MRQSLSWLCVLCVFVVTSVHAGDIAELKKIVTDKSYKNYWDRLRAIDKLGETGNKESIVILADLLDDDEPPIREAAVMALGNLTDAEAIEYLASTSLFHPKSSRCRWHCAWALGLIKNEKTLPQLLKALNDPYETVQVKTLQAISALPNGAAASETLIKELNDNNTYIRAAAASALGALRDPNALPHLIKKVNDSQWIAKAAVLEAITAIDPKSALAYVTAGLKNSAPEIRIVSLELLPQLAADKTAVSPALMRDKPALIKYASELLVDKNDAVRATAVLVLRQMRDKDCVAPLIQQLNSAKWRLRYDIITALKDLTNAPLGYSAKSWTGWFEANKDRIEIAPIKSDTAVADAKSDETIPTFFEIPIFGKNIIFVIDFSGSMKNTAAGEKGDTKAEVAIKELESTLKALSEQTKFNIIIMNTEATKLKKRKAAPAMVAALEPNKKLAMEFVRSVWDKLEDLRRGRGDHFDALVEAISEPDVDTIFLLSDGKPTYGTYIVDENIIENIGKYNRFRKVVINTVMTGERGTNQDLMQKLAEMSNGIFNHR